MIRSHCECRELCLRRYDLNIILQQYLVRCSLILMCSPEFSIYREEKTCICQLTVFLDDHGVDSVAKADLFVVVHRWRFPESEL